MCDPNREWPAPVTPLLSDAAPQSELLMDPTAAQLLGLILRPGTPEYAARHAGLDACECGDALIDAFGVKGRLSCRREPQPELHFVWTWQSDGADPFDLEADEPESFLCMLFYAALAQTSA